MAEEHDNWVRVLGADVAAPGARYGDEDANVVTPMALDDDVVPRPMPRDCKLTPGKIKGPKNHVLCGKHGHVIDTKKRMVIANSLDEYNQAVWFDDEDMSTSSQDKETARSAQTMHDTAPIMAEQEKKNAENERKAQIARYHDVAAAAHTAVIATTTQYDVAVIKACARFQSYAEKYIDEMKQTEADDLFASLVEFAAKTVLGELGKKALAELEGAAKKVGEKIEKVVEDKLVKAVKSTVPKAKGADALRKAMAVLINQAGAMATAAGQAAEEGIGKDLQRIADNASKGQLSGDDEALIKPFLDRDYNEILESFRIPSSKTAAALQGKIYSGLVKEFYAEYYQQHRLNEGLRYETDSEAHKIGEKHAQEELKKLDEEIKGSGALR